jgi:flagellar motor switch protein FliN/FliY
MHVPAAQPPSSSGHLTVKELLAKNPATAYMPNPLARAAMMQQPMYQQQHQRVPGWAQGGQMMPQQPMYPQQQPMYQQPMYQQPMYPQQQPIYPQQMQQQPMYPQQMQQPMVPQQMPGYRPPWQ